MFQGRIRTGEREIEEFQQSLESLKVSASAVLEDSEALFADMALRLEKTKAEVRARLEAKERAVVGRAERDIEMLEKDLEELRRRDEEISQLLQTEDNAHFLQVRGKDTWQMQWRPHCCAPAHHRSALQSPQPAYGGLQRRRRALCHLRSRVEEVCREEVDKISRAVNENYISGGECVKDSCRLSLDPDTAHPTLILVEGPQGAHCGEEPQSYPPHPQRFDSVAQVLCREGQFGGASYWEVEWRGGGWIDIGVTYRGIGRKGGGKPCLLDATRTPGG
ncbi:hypothetical protein INR49_019376 [Caranx melampygus]|nr:hypothetical protein INR49_019376 [Caranx melampygus]